MKELTPVVCVGVALSCGFLLWAPTGLLNSLTLLALRDEHRAWLGLGLVLSIAFLFAHVIAKIGQGARALVAHLWDRHKARAKAKQGRVEAELGKANKRRVLEQLTPEEKGYLRPYIEQQLTTLRLLTDDGIAGGLRAKGVLYVSAQTGDVWTGFDHNLNSWAREMLTADRSLMEGAQGTPRKPQRVF